MKNSKKNIKKKGIVPKNKRVNLIVYLVLRFFVIICMIDQGIRGNWNNVALCIATLILFLMPSLLARRLKVDLPNTLEVIVYLFIFSSTILGEIQNFYGVFPYWDTMLHTLNGFLCAAIGFSLVDILNNHDNFHITMTPGFVALVAFSFSMTVGVMWEFGEFAVDRYLLKDMQKDRIVNKISSVKLNEENANEPVVIDNINKIEIYTADSEDILVIEGGYLELGLIDTMKDLFVNFIGAIVYSILGYLYIKNRDDYKFAERFIPRLKKKNA